MLAYPALSVQMKVYSGWQQHALNERPAASSKDNGEAGWMQDVSDMSMRKK